MDISLDVFRFNALQGNGLFIFGGPETAAQCLIVLVIDLGLAIKLNVDHDHALMRAC